MTPDAQARAPVTTTGRTGTRWWASRTNRLSSLLLFAAVAVAPLPFGSTDPATIALLCILLGAALACASHSPLQVGHFVLLGLILVVILAYAFVLHEQISQHALIARPHPVWDEAAKLLGIPLDPSVSIARNQPWLAIGPPLSSLLALITGFIVGSDRHHARSLVRVVAWSGLAYAIYGIAAHLLDPTHILWRQKYAYLTSLTATFINRNTAALYFGTCSVLWLLLFTQSIRQQLPVGPIEWKQMPYRLRAGVSRMALVQFTALVVCLTAVFMTTSRAGAILSLMALVVSLALFFRRDLPSWSGRVMALVVCSAVAFVLLHFLGTGRFDVHGLADGGRFETYRSVLRMLMDHPWFGTGQGTFVWSYPPYRSSEISMLGIWDRAHSTPLELAADMGVPLASLVVAGWIVIFAVLSRAVYIRRRDAIVPIAALTIAILAVSHSLVDFSLQIPGYSIVALALIGAGLAQSFKSTPPQGLQTLVRLSGQFDAKS